MTAYKSGEEFPVATDFQRQREIPKKMPAISIDGFDFDNAYPGHAAGEDGRLHVPAEGLIGRKVAGTVDIITTPASSVEDLEKEMKSLVSMASEDVARGDLLVPSLVGYPTEQDLTHYLKGLMNQKVLESHRAVLDENRAQKALIDNLVATVRTYAPELLPAVERQMRSRWETSDAPAIESVTDSAEHVPSVNTLDRIFSSGSISKVLNFFGVHRPS
jgi:hypothetical protein